MKPAGHRIHTAIIFLLAAGVLLLLGWTLLTGWDFYRTALEERPHHPDFRAFRPAGQVGHGLGLLGSAMILLLLLYSLRKRARWLRRAGDLRIWLRYHIFLGVAGPVLITLHTSGKIGGLVSISFWSMAAVALSGVFGRYLYQQIPRNVLGETMSSDQIEIQNEEILVRLTGQHGLDQAGLDSLEKLAIGPLEGKSALAALLVLPWHNLRLASHLQRWAAGQGSGADGEVVDLARLWALQSRRLHLFHTIRDLFHYWHVFHKPFAVIMIIVMIIHVAVALALGYTWFSGPAPV
jgi:hypothetical protein